MPKVGNIDRTASDVGTVVHENYVNEVLPWMAQVVPMAGLFSRIGPKGYQLIGEKLVVARKNKRRGGYVFTDGYLPEPQASKPINLEFTPARGYISGAVDRFVAAIAVKPGAFEDFEARLVDEMFEAAEWQTGRYLHGASTATVCKVTSVTSTTEIVVEDGYGYDGMAPSLFLDEGMVVAVLDASASFAVLGATKISSIDHDTSATTATLTLGTAISGMAAGDLIVMATSNVTGDTHFVHERNRAPLGLLDIIDPADSLTTYGGLTESTTPHINPVRRASSDFGHIELMEFLAEISAKSTSPVSAQSHVLTMQEGVKIELAKELIPFQQQSQLGRELQGGWRTVRVADFDILTDPYHIPDVVYALCPEDLHVVDISGDLQMYNGDGSDRQRMTDYDGESWFAFWYGNRFAGRRNRLGALTGVSNPNKERYIAIPT